MEEDDTIQQRPNIDRLRKYRPLFDAHSRNYLYLQKNDFRLNNEGKCYEKH